MISQQESPYASLSHGSKTLFESEVVQVGATRCPATHPDFEIPGPIQRHALYLGGSPVRVLRGGQESFFADSTTVSFHNRGDEIERRSHQGRGDYSNWFAITPDYIHSALEELEPEAVRAPDHLERPFSWRTGPCPPRCFLAQRLLIDALERPTPPDALVAEETALTILREASRAALGHRAAPRRETTDARHAGLVDAAKDLLSETFQARLGLPEVAAAIGSSPFHLARIFRDHTGWTLHGFRTQLRVRAAAEAVLAGEDDLAQLALELGFSSHSHLTTAFKRVFGFAPSHLRKRDARALEELLRDEAPGGPTA